MKKLLYILLPLCLLLSCTQIGGQRTVQVELTAATATSADKAYDFACSTTVGYATDAGDGANASVSLVGVNHISGSFEVSSSATTLWCFTPGAYGEGNAFSIPAQVVKVSPVTSDEIDGMVFCSSGVALSSQGTCTGVIKPITSAVVLEVLDSRGKQCGKKFTSVSMKADGASLAGDIKLRLQDARIGELSNTSSTLDFDCSAGSFTVGEAGKPVSLGAVVLPCSFTGTITVTGDGFKATFNIKDAINLQAGFVKTVSLDFADAEMEGEKHMPTRLGILGDSISTFKGIIPSDHRTYYPTTNVACKDVDAWEKTYWGHLINDYWHCELDVNSAWSGSCVADGDPTVVRTPFVKRCSLFKNPDVIIVFGGTNDCQTERMIGLGEFDYTSSLDKLNTYRRFRESYIWVIKTLQANYPEAQLICIVGNHIDGEYGNSVAAIAKELGIPCVDFRGDQSVTQYEQLHPNAAGHAHMAQRIYEETLYLFQ